jgi:5'-deoxynucleotidase YfbR-like HD superfamily hydrolase
MRYSVGHHSCDMITLIVLLWRAAHAGALPRAELLAAAAFHDTPERVTGDIPSVIKAPMAAAFARVEARVESFLVDAALDLTAEELAWLRAADQLELVLWCYEENRRGNHTFDDWIPYYKKKWAAQPLPEPFMDLFYAWQFNPLRLNDDDMKEFRG